MKSDTYYGKKASGYDEKRRTQARWKLEHEAVAKMLSGIKHDRVIDCPVGTGRFLELYKKLDVKHVEGIDASNEMIRVAEKKTRNKEYRLFVGDATQMNVKEHAADAAVCMRFLDLIDEATLAKVMTELTRVVTAKGSIICTIRLGDQYVAKTNTATHDRKKWNALLKRLGWKIEETVPIFNAGWVVLRLERNK